MSEPARDEIVPLWPTWIGQMQLPGAEEANRALLDLAPQKLEAVDLFHLENPSAAWLRGWMDVAVAQWFDKVKVQPAPQWRASGRLESLGFGQYRELGNEPGAYLAGFYFVNTPAPPELSHLRSDCVPSHLSLLDPRVGFNALHVDGDRYFVETYTLPAVPGQLMLWPGYLRHCSRVHLAHEPWVRVALRVDLEREGGMR